MLRTAVELPGDQIEDFCRRWKIARLEIFGSALRDDFGPDSDVDFLANFMPDAGWSLLNRVSMKLELEALLGREVDLLNRAALERRPHTERSQAVLNTAELLYAQP